MRWVADSLVHMISAPASAQMCSAAMGVDTGRATLACRDPGHHQVQEQEEGLVVGEDLALVVDEREVLPARVDDRPQVCPRGPHQVGHVAGRGPGSLAMTAAVAA